MDALRDEFDTLKIGFYKIRSTLEMPSGGILFTRHHLFFQWYYLFHWSRLFIHSIGGKSSNAPSNEWVALKEYQCHAQRSIFTGEHARMAIHGKSVLKRELKILRSNFLKSLLSLVRELAFSTR